MKFKPSIVTALLCSFLHMAAAGSDQRGPVLTSSYIDLSAQPDSGRIQMLFATFKRWKPQFGGEGMPLAPTGLWNTMLQEFRKQDPNQKITLSSTHFRLPNRNTLIVRPCVDLDIEEANKYGYISLRNGIEAVVDLEQNEAVDIAYIPLALLGSTAWSSSRSHWVLLVLNRSEKSAVLYDPTHKLKTLGYKGETLQQIVLESGYGEITELDLYHQGMLNLKDCAWYVLAYIRLLCEGKDLMNEETPVEQTKHEIIEEYRNKTGQY